MQIDTKDILKIFQKKKVWKKNEFEINTNLYWRYLLGLVVVVVTGSFIFGYIVYNNIKHEPLFVPSASIEAERMDQKNRILEMLKYFDARDAKSDAIILNPSPIVDPSL
ncbi:MAG: hypothetical protein ACKOW9_01195 [Candidatus Paceibacterota bacterium]